MVDNGCEITLLEVERQGLASGFLLETITNTNLELKANRLMKKENFYTGKVIKACFQNNLWLHLKIVSLYIPFEILTSDKLIPADLIYDTPIQGSISFRTKFEFEQQGIACIEIGDSNLFVHTTISDFMNMI